MWELAVMKEHHEDMTSREALAALVARMGSPNMEVGASGALMCASPCRAAHMSGGPHKLCTAGAMRTCGVPAHAIQTLRRIRPQTLR